MIELRARGASDIGKKRTENEDSIGVDETRGIFVLADGMGGHEGGATASKAAVATVHDELAAAGQVFDRFRDDPNVASQTAAIAAMVTAVERTCARVFELGGESKSKSRMGSTLDVVIRVGDRIILGHVGDGRIYLLRDGKCYRLTEDHTLVAEQIKLGLLKESEAHASQFRGVLTRAIGTHRSVKVDTLILDLFPGDRLVMCSDGLHRYAQSEDLLRLAGTPDGSAPSVVTQLIAHANAGGGVDNISVILLACAAPAAQAATPAKPLATSKVASRIDAICALPLFRHLTYREQVAVLSVARARTFEPGATIVKQGEVGSEMFLIIEGQLVVERNGVKIAELGSGGHFGEMSLVDDSLRSATVKVVARTEVLTIGQSEINSLMRAEPVLAVKVLWDFVQVLSTRLRAASAEITELQLGQMPPMSVVPPFRVP